MNIIICGAGKVGFSISKQLSAQGHSVTVIDQSSEDIKKINDTQDVKGIVGRATLPSVLENAGAEKADMVIAVTRNDETNMIVCQLASSLFNVSKKIARIRTKDFLEGKWGKLYNKSNIPIDVIISPELEVAKSLYRRLEAPGALDNVPFGKNKVKMLEISIEKNCPIKNMPLKKLTEKFPDFKANILGAMRKGKFVYLKKNDQMLEDDNVYVVVSSDQLTPILKAFGHEEKVSKNVLIIGGGNIFRGLQGSDKGIDRTTGDSMGMLATVINGLALMDRLEKMGAVVRVQSAIPMDKLAEPYIQRRAIRHLERGRIVIFVAGTGNPYFSTDTAAALRASEISADIILKATKVDGIYDKHPHKHDDAKKYDRLSYMECLENRLSVMDSTAFSLCMDNRMPILVFDLRQKKSIRTAVSGKSFGTIVEE